MKTTTEQPTELKRVTSRIANAVLAFCHGKNEFHAAALREHVDTKCGVTAPGSADRVLRSLRAQGLLDYKCISRRDSLYQLL